MEAAGEISTEKFESEEGVFKQLQLSLRVSNLHEKSEKILATE